MLDSTANLEWEILTFAKYNDTISYKFLWRRRDEAVDKSKKFYDNVGPAHGSGLVFGSHRGAGGRNRG